MKNKKVKKSGKAEEKNNKPGANKEAVQKAIENHKQAAAHHIEAAKHHMDAAKFYKAGNSEKAAHSTILAYGHHAIAGEFLSDEAKHHAQLLKETNYR